MLRHLQPLHPCTPSLQPLCTLGTGTSLAPRDAGGNLHHGTSLAPPCTAAPRRGCPWRGCSTGCARTSGYSGCARRLWAARHSQKEAQPLPRVLELAAACKVAHFTAFDHPGADQPAQQLAEPSWVPSWVRRRARKFLRQQLPGAAAAGRRDARGPAQAPAQAHARADLPALGRRRAELRHLTSHVSRLPASTPPHPPTHLHGSPHGRAWAPRLVPPVRRRRKPIEAWSPP